MAKEPGLSERKLAGEIKTRRQREKNKIREINLRKTYRTGVKAKKQKREGRVEGKHRRDNGTEPEESCDGGSNS